MKKLLVFIGVLFLMSGCDDASMSTLSCSSTSTANGVTTKTTYDIKYSGDEVKHVTITNDYSQDVVNGNDNAVDGVDVDTDGMDQDANTDNGQLESDDVVDGVVGDTIDGVVDGVKDTILDLAGIRNTYENQMRNFDNIEGFSYNVDVDNDNEYRVVYDIDMDEISDDNLANFDVTRDFSDVKQNYEDLGYTCE